MAEISNLSIRVSANTEKATTNINSLIGSLKGLQGTIASLNPGLSAFATNMSKVASSLKGVGRKGISGVTASAKAVASSTVDNASPSGVASVTDSAAIGELANNLEKVSSASKNAREEIGRVRIETNSAGKEAKKSVSGFKKLASSFKRILMYRMLRSLIKAITQALKEGVNNLYQWSKAMDSAGYGQFAKTMDSLATSFKYLKNSLGAMVAPLISALAPAINWVIDRFVDLLNVVNQVFAFLSGQSSWTRAKRVPTEFGEAADKASGSAKELRDVLADFDEINLIDPGKAGGGGGGGASAIDYEDMFEVVNGFDDLVTKLQPLKDLMDTIVPLFEELGNWAVTTLLPNVLESIAYQVSSLATDVKGIIDGIKEGNAYDIINNIKNLIVDLVYGPLEAFATLWDSIFGTNYAEFIRAGMEVMKEFDIAGFFVDQWDQFKRFWAVDFASIIEAAWLTAKQKVEYLVEAAKGLWKGLTTGDFDDYNAAAEKFNNSDFWSNLDTVHAKNLEIYNEAQIARLAVNVYDGKYDNLARAAVLMPNSSAKKVLTSVSKGKTWSQVAYTVLTSKNGVRSVKADLAKGAKWQADAWKVIDAASAKKASYALDVNVNPKIKNKLNARDMINFKDQYIKLYGTSGSVGQLRIMGSGGFLEAGQLFVAREAGPEFVGSMNGQTAVANNEQIVEGVASGVFRAIVNTGIVDAVRQNKGNNAPVFAPSVEAGRWIQRSLNLYQTVG